MTEQIKFKGPFFQTDVGKTIKAAINQAVIDVSKAAVNEVKAELTPGHGVDSGKYRKGIRRSKRGMSSRVFGPDNRIQAWLEGTSERNRTTKFKGYGVMGRAAERTDRTAAAAARQALATLVRELN